MHIEACLELANHEVALGVLLDTLDGESANPWVHLARQLLGLGVPGLKVEWVFPVEGEDLGRWHDITLVEDGQVGVFIRNVL